MKQVAAIKKVSDPFVDKDIVIFNWAKTCTGTKERVFAAMTAARATEGGKFKTGDVVTVGFNNHANKVIMAAPGRSRILAQVQMEANDAESVLTRLGWEIAWVDVPETALGKFQKSPWEWLMECPEAAVVR